MFELQTPLLFATVAALTLATAVTILVLWSRGRRPTARWPVPRLVGRAALLALLMALTCFTLFLHVNNTFGFFTSWADLVGRPATFALLGSTGLPAGQGRVEKLTVRGTASQGHGSVLVWLPPQYEQPEWKNARFPVVFMLPGQTSPEKTFALFQFGPAASQAIAAGEAKPFIAVFPPIQIAPPRDTECIDVPHGPQAESWLTRDVTDAVQAHYRVPAPGPQWTIAGYSTGGFCAANLGLRNPARFGAAISLGGDFVPYVDQTTGDLFGGDQARRDANTPLWLYRHNGGTRGVKLLVVTGQQDVQSWPSSSQMIQLAQGDPNVASIVYPTGGHNFLNYVAQWPGVFRWLDASGALG